MRNLFLIILINTLLFFSEVYSKDITIKYKIDNEIITNLDILNEIEYLIAFNNDLKILSKEELIKIGVKSKIREKIKLLEVSKYFDLEKPNEELDKLVENNLIINLNLSSKDEILNFMSENNISYENINLKYKIDLFWNKMIYDKYVTKISVNEEELLKKIKQESTSEFTTEFFLSEILFEISKNENYDSKYIQIIKSIDDNNFKIAAGNFSISDSALKGGEIGWVKKTQISNKILKEIEDIEIGQITKPIPVGNGFLIIKLVNKRETKKIIDIEKELQNLIEKETDKQLSLYSSNLFKKIKNNIYINEL